MEDKTAISSRLYPVVCFVTGTTPNGGGIWKYILHGSPHGLLRRNLPVMTQVLHFLDFKISPKTLQERWRRPLREKYNGNFGLKYTNSIFMDSGGFTLMFDPELDLTNYNISKNQLAEGILKLQLDMGGDFVVSLDYPIPPKLEATEVNRRMDANLSNAIRTARILADMNSSVRPRLYVPIHGSTPDAVGYFTRTLLEHFRAEGLENVLYGLALGSMVPLRTSNRSAEILTYVQMARKEMPPEMPLHVFGVTGLLAPFLLAQGATSFDTSTYVQNARSLKYVDPVTRKSRHLRELTSYPCNCPVCQERDIRADLDLMDGRKEGYKSEVYATIALHNLEQDFRLLDEAQVAENAGELSSFLEELAHKFRHANLLWKAMQGSDADIKQLELPVETAPIRSHKPEDFDVHKLNYKPSVHKHVCLVLPCSQEKPYTSSQSFQFIWRRLIETLGKEAFEDIEIVFLSGLYGPVPIEYVEEDAVRTYDFLLNYYNTTGIQRVAQRLVAFLNAHETQFSSTICYITLPTYRKIIEIAFRECHELQLIPVDGRKGRTAFYRPENVDQLVKALQLALNPKKEVD